MKDELDEETIYNKISAASDPEHIDFPENDRHTIIEQIAHKLPSKKKNSFGFLVKKYLPIAACLCLIVGGIAGVLSFAMSGSLSADPDTVVIVTSTELREKVPGVLLPKIDDYNLSSGQLILSSKTQKQRYAEMIYLSASDKITLYILLDEDYKLSALKDFPQFNQKISVNGLYIDYAISDSKAYAQFASGYNYFMTFDSEQPENITALFEFFV